MAEIDDNIREAEEEERAEWMYELEKELEEAKKTIEAQKEEINTLKGYLRKFGFTDG
jgi:predicted RNase H-like nuclease (RuvC/YqgF family)